MLNTVLGRFTVSYCFVEAGAIIRDGDRNQVSFSVMGLSLSKKTNVLFLAKIAPYARDARACNCSDRARRN